MWYGILDKIGKDTEQERIYRIAWDRTAKDRTGQNKIYDRIGNITEN